MKDYLPAAKRQFTYYKSLGEKTIQQLNDEELFWQYNEASNSVAIIVKHLWGNMCSRWTDFLTSDGEKEWRKRDSEFEDDIRTKSELMEKWEEGWTVLLDTIDSLTEEDLSKEIYIRNMGHSVVEAIERQTSHYAYHIGQMVFLGKMLKGDDWQSLSIPKGKSTDYNKDKFDKPQRKEHFTDDL